MKDRLLVCERASTKMYDVCQLKQAKHHMVISKVFVKHAINDQMDMNKFRNIRHLSINFVLCNPAYKRKLSKVDLEKKYYAILNKIMAASPKLNTIEYDLTESSFRSHFERSDKWNKQYEGSLFDFASNLSTKYLKRIYKLIWTEKEMKDIQWIPGGGKSIECAHRWLLHQSNISPFIKMFENVKSLTIPNHLNLSSYPMVSQIWSNRHYYEHLEHLHIDLSQIVMDAAGDDNDDDIVTEIGHPLTMLHRFKALRSVYLKLPIFRGCTLYYDALLATNQHTNAQKNVLLTDVHFDFCIDSDIRDGQTVSVIDFVWSHIVNRVCPNLKRLECRIQNQSNKLFASTHSYISKLNCKRIESIVYESDASDFKSNIVPMLKCRIWHNLKELKLNVNAMRSDNDEHGCWEQLNLSSFECLQSFAIEYTESCGFDQNVGFYGTVTQNILHFLEFMIRQKNVCLDLRRLSLFHQANRKKRYAPHIRGLSVSESDSERICKLLTKINTKHKGIEFIDLCPVVIRRKQLKYLNFWTKINVIEWHQVKKAYFVDLNIRNKLKL